MNCALVATSFYVVARIAEAVNQLTRLMQERACYPRRAAAHTYCAAHELRLSRLLSRLLCPLTVRPWLYHPMEDSCSYHESQLGPSRGCTYCMPN